MDNKEGSIDNDIEKGVINEQLTSIGVVHCNVSSMIMDNKKEAEDEKGGGDDVKKAKAMSAKKPPRPPRGLSLDSGDQKLIRELHELAKLKRARIDRMKALKKSKEAKIGSSKNHLFWTLLTALFCFVLVFQGISSRTNSGVKFQGSPISTEAIKGNVISIRHFPSSLATHVNKPASEFPRRVELVSGSESDTPGQGREAQHSGGQSSKR